MRFGLMTNGNDSSLFPLLHNSIQDFFLRVSPTVKQFLNTSSRLLNIVFFTEEEGLHHSTGQEPSNSNKKNHKKPKIKNMQDRTCKECNKIFKYKCDLIRHLHVHSDEKHYTCITCNKAFKTKRNLDTHMLVHSEIIKKHVCDVCKVAFRQRAHLADHKLIHTNERPYACTQCDKKFRAKSVLTKHLRTHSSEESIARPYKCEICEKAFKQKPHLDSHIRTHTGDKRYECEYCNKRFVQKFSLTQHVRKHNIRKITT